MMNLEAEYRNGYFVSAEMKKVWAVQIELLNKLLEVCNKHNLQIWAEGGTLLGTVRHNGFIPWDDDIDVVMLREDYDKLVQIAPEEFDHPYFFQCGYTEKLYPRGHAQLRMDGTTAILPYPAFVDTHQGIFIDIFVLDAVPDNDDEMRRQIMERNAMFDKMQHVFPFDFLHMFRSLSLLRYRRNFVDLFSRYEELFKRYRVEDNEFVSLHSFLVDFDRFLRKKQWYNETIQMPFEDIMLPVPIGYNEILSKQYGDYMSPKKSPSNHGGFWKLDAETPYSDYLPDLKKFYRRNKWRSYIRRINNLVKKVFNNAKGQG